MGSYTTPPVTDSDQLLGSRLEPVRPADSAAAVADEVVLAITTSNPWPAVAAGASYALTLTATESTAPYTWEATRLPSGLTLNPATGDVTGTPNAAGTFASASA